MKKWKSILSLVLVLAMLTQLLPMEIFAEAEDTVIRKVTTLEQAAGLDPNSEEYIEWKENYVAEQQQEIEQIPTTPTGSAIDVYQEQKIEAPLPMAMMATVSQNKLSNDFIEIAVNRGGRFTVGTTGGNPDNSLDDHKKMLFGHPSSTTSYTTFRVDGVNQIFASNSTTIFDSENNSCSNAYAIGGISIDQILTLIKNTSTNREDTVEIKYVVKNNDTVNHDAGIRIMMDTMLGDNDAAPFRIPGIGAVNTETELTGDNIPEYWQAFDSLTNPTVISQGTLLRSLDNKPDKVQFVNWGRAKSNPWMDTVNTGSSNGDSAVCVYWNPKALTPGETREYVTYYGLSEFQQDLRPPLAVSITGSNNIVATESGYNPNPFTVTAYVMDNGTASATNVKARLDLPVGLRLAGGQQNEISLGTISPDAQEKQASWEIEIESSSVERNLTYSVVVSADNTESKTITRNIFIPASIEVNPIDNLSVESTDSTAIVSWSVPAGSSGSVALSNTGGYYAFQPYDDGTVVAAARAADARFAATSVVNKSLKFENLSENTEYNYTILATVNGRTYSKMGNFTTKSSKVVIIIHGIAASSLQVTHVEKGATTPTTHEIWKPRVDPTLKLEGIDLQLDHDMNLLACDNNGDSVYNVKTVPWQTNGVLDEYYGKLKSNLEKEGYKVFYFPYDWRLDNSYTADLLADFIKAMGVRKVSIVAHSNGGIVAAKYIANGNASKIDKLVTIATPYLGSPKGLYVLETGKFFDKFDLGLIFSKENWVNLFGNGLLAESLLKLGPNLKSLYQLLPSPQYFTINNTYYLTKYVDKPLWFTGDDIYNLTDYNQTKDYILNRSWVNKAHLESAQNFQNSLNLYDNLRSVNSYFIIGDKQPTIGRIKAQFNKHGEFWRIKDFDPINGDGTVPIISAQAGAATNVNRRYYVNGGHSSLPNMDNVIQQVINILKSTSNNLGGTITGEPPALAKGVHTIPESTKKLKLKVECPVELHVYDNSRNHLGPTTNGNIDESIEAASYYVLDDTKIAFLNEDDYSVEMKGTGNGFMTYTIDEYDENDTKIKTIRFDNIEITSSTAIKSDTNINRTINLYVDDNGDEIVDRTISPSVILDEAGSNDITPPTISANIIGNIGNNGWYTSDVKIGFNTNDAESGINSIEYKLNDLSIKNYNSEVTIDMEGTNKIGAVAYNNNQLVSDEVYNEIKIDKTAPSIKTNIDNRELMLNEKVKFEWLATDSISGLESSDSEVANGAIIDTSSLGNKSIKIKAKDNAGNEINKVITYTVKCDFSTMKSMLNQYVLGSFNEKVPVSINAYKLNINGNIYSNNNFVYRGSELNIIGTCSTAGKIDVQTSKSNISSINEGVSKINMPNVLDGVRALLKSKNAEYFSGDKQYNSDSISIVNPLLVDGKISFNGTNFTGNGFIEAKNDIDFNLSNLKADDKVLITSDNGNININTSDCTINGIIYAPNGTVTINTSNLNINGYIIAKEVVITGSIINIKSNKTVLNLLDN